MDAFVVETGTITFHEVRGTALSSNMTTRTNVSVSGGGGHIGPNGGYVAAPQLRTSSTEIRSLWVRTEEGRDDYFSLVGTTAAVTGGQRVVMLLGKTNTSPDAWPVVLVNVDSQRYHPLAGVQSLAAGLLAPPAVAGPILIGLLSFVISFVIWVSVDRYSPWKGMAIVPMLFGPVACFFWFIASALGRNSRYEALHKLLAAHVDAQGKAILSDALRHRQLSGTNF